MDSKKSKHNRSTINKFRYTVMVFMLVPIVIFNIFTVVVYSNIVKSKNDEKLEVAYLEITETIERQFVGVTKTATTLSNTRDVRQFLISDGEAIATDYGKKKSIGGILENELLRNECSAQMFVYSAKSEYVQGDDSWVSCMKYVKKKPEWYTKYIATGEPKQITCDETYITVTTPIRFSNGGILGILAVDLNKQALKQRISLDKYKSDIAIRIVSPSGAELMSVGEVNPMETREYTSRATNAKIQFIIGVNESRQIVGTVVVYLVICLLLCLLLTFLISTLCATSLYDSVVKVLSKIGVLEEASVENMCKNNRETNQNSDVEENLAKMMKKLQSTQLTALQMQINPHFVFNVLNYANVEILRNDESNDKAAKILALLSDVLNYAMSEPKYSALIIEEIEMTKKYIEIEKIETGTDFDVEWKIAADVLDKDCIKLFLQPIVENSIMHGMKNLKDRRGRIAVTAKLRGEDVIVTVTDNGNGMTAEKLKSMKAKLGEIYDDYSKHIGLRNVNERLKLVYGEGYGVAIDSDNNGTKVTIKLGGDNANQAVISENDYQMGGG